MKITFDTKNIKKNFMKNGKHLVLAVALALSIAFLFTKLVLPLGIYILNNFVLLLRLWILLTDVNFKFIGGIFFLIVAWKFFGVLCNILSELLVKYTEQYNLWRNK